MQLQRNVARRVSQVEADDRSPRLCGRRQPGHVEYLAGQEVDAREQDHGDLVTVAMKQILHVFHP